MRSGPRRPAAKRRVGQIVGELGRRHLAAFGSGRAGASADLAEAPQIMRAAGLRAGARKPLAAEWLRADDRADLVAVDVDVAGVDAVDDLLDARLDARVQAEGQAVALAVDVRK